jgi:predicted nucleic acid-binding protein
MSPRLLVADSGPLIALARLGLLHLPGQMFSQVFVTLTVWNEVTGGDARAEHPALRQAERERWLNIAPDPDNPPAQFASSLLDEGERSALALSLALGPGCDVLIDERRGRWAAQAAGLQVLGTLGLLARARQLGLVGPVRPLAEDLMASGYHLARPLVEETLAVLGE